MKKYIPSIKNNNNLKNEFLKEYKQVLFKINKGKINTYLEYNDIKPIIDSLDKNINDFEGTLGTGEENIYEVYSNTLKSLNDLSEKFNQDLVSQIEEAADDLIYNVNLWSEILNGTVTYNNLEVLKERISFGKKRILNRLNELEDIKEQFIANERRLNDEIVSLENNLKELDEMILKEDNERRINDLYRNITSNKSKLDTLNVRRSNYNACYNLLDLIFVNAKEIVAASDYSNVDLVKAKALLNIGKLKTVLNEPDKAISILKRMEKDVTEINEKTKVIDNKVLSVDNNTLNVSSDALAYKGMLMKKKRDKNALEHLDDNTTTPIEENKVKGEN